MKTVHFTAPGCICVVVYGTIIAQKQPSLNKSIHRISTAPLFRWLCNKLFNYQQTHTHTHHGKVSSRFWRKIQCPSPKAIWEEFSSPSFFVGWPNSKTLCDKKLPCKLFPLLILLAKDNTLAGSTKPNTHTRARASAPQHTLKPFRTNDRVALKAAGDGMENRRQCATPPGVRSTHTPVNFQCGPLLFPSPRAPSTLTLCFRCWVMFLLLMFLFAFWWWW